MKKLISLFSKNYVGYYDLNQEVELYFPTSVATFIINNTIVKSDQS